MYQPLHETRLVPYPFHYVEQIIYPNENITLLGYFQSEKYFKDSRDEILNVFDFEYVKQKVPIDFFEFGKKRYTSIHVRKGDYVNLQTFYHPLTKEYYDSAIGILRDKTDEFLVFSDDINTCKEMFYELKNVRFIENQKDYIELYLMSLCDNNIIANSSFSWRIVTGKQIGRASCRERVSSPV